MNRTLTLLALAAGLAAPATFAQSTTPKVVKKIPVEFPADAVRKGVDRGVFKARLTIDGEGNVTESSIVEATPAKAKLLNASVLESLGLQDTETKFQISLKSKLWENILGNNGDLWFGYTQSSRWQLFNSQLSRPFRETDYEPELILNFRTQYDLPWGWTGRMSGVSFTHVSNGRDIPLSRSWNRVIGQFGIDRPGWTLVARPWWRVHEDRSSDDNPDIEDYMGRGEILVTRNWGGHEISALLRHSLRGGDRSHGAVELNWAFPIYGELKGYLQFFSGYGESLIDYNHSANYVGLGVSLIEWYSDTAETRRR